MPYPKKLKLTKSALEDLYWRQDFSLREIASKFGVKATSVHHLMIKLNIPRRNLSMANSKPKMAGKNPNWKGDNIKPHSGRGRAYRLFSTKQPCSVCGVKAEIHHKDGNPCNNDPSNIDWLCRKHHMEADGRMARRNKGQFAGADYACI